MNRPLLAYLVARSTAAEIDRHGPPGPFLRALVMIPAALLVLGFGAMAVFFVVSFTAWELGIG